MRRVRIEQGAEVMYADETGRIERPGLVNPSDRWRIVGAVTRNNFGAVTRRWTLKEVLTSPELIPWKFKNGRQRSYILDFDHGTLREWSSPGHSLSTYRA